MNQNESATQTQIPRAGFGALAVLLATGLFLSPACNTPVGNPSATENFGAAPTSTDASVAAGQVGRDIEEADIIKIADGKLYALNRYKGLIILDVSVPDAPVLLGTLDLRGRGVEMYVVGQRVYAVLSADYYVAYDNAGGGPGGAEVNPVMAPSPPAPGPDFEGSQLAIIDAQNPAVPVLLDKIDLPGFASDSRRVGDVIYIVGANGYPFYLRPDDMQQQDEGFVASVNVADPNNVIPVERKTFSGDSLAIHVSDQLILAASQEYVSSESATKTRVQVIDTSDVGGAIAIRGSVLVPGTIRNRFYMDDFQSVLRIVTQSSGFGFRQVKLFTYSLADLDNITALGSVLIKQGETAEAVRFDGERGYVVTFLRVDPLFVLNLSDPANPTVSGQLKVPGFSTHIEPRGNRLMAVGIDDTNGTRPALAYYNVEEPANPTELSRVVLGPPGSFTESEATYDEKAFKIVDDLGLVAVPFHHVDYPDNGGGPVPATGAPVSDTIPEKPTCLNAVQLVDFNDTALVQRGSFEHQGRVERVGAIDGRVFALSQAAFQTVNIANRDAPAKTGEVKFFNASEEAIYGDECGYIWLGGMPTEPVGPMDILGLLTRFCGTTSVMPLLVTILCLVIARGSRRRKPTRDT